MSVLIVASRRKDWPIDVPNVEIVEAWDYLTRAEYAQPRNVKVFNLCRSYRYQSTGYYVSLLAEARGHRPLPSVTTVQDLSSQSLIRTISDELDELIQSGLARMHSDEFTLSIYFGRNIAKRYERLSLHLFNMFQAPLLRIRFGRQNGKWQVRGVRAISASEVPESHRPFLAEAAQRYFARGTTRPRRARARYDLAVLHSPEEKENSPSDEKALRRFVKAGESLGLGVELITRDDFGRLAEFDALFLRETTAVNHHTYRFARRAESEGMVVIDDPRSIVRCTNKVYLAEILQRQRIPTPRTLMVHRNNIDQIADELGFPCVIKKPDSSFSSGVVKVESREILAEVLERFLGESELVVAQQFIPTPFDWRIGVLDRRPLYTCKYFMAPGHWQIIRQDRRGRGRYGKSETIPVELAPRRAVALAVKAANLIGDGFYGVDVKQDNGQFYVLEINDNPSIDAGTEDAVLREALYERVMSVFLSRIEQRKARTYG